MSLLGVTGPTSSPESRARAGRLTLVYTAAFALAAGLVTLAVFGIRQLLPGSLGIPPIAVGLLLAYLAACDARLGRLRTPGAWRQTCPAWRHRFGLTRATALWGLDIGTTVSTIKMTSLYWASIIVLLTVSPPRPELAVACFAAGYLLTHLAGVWRITRGVSLTSALAWANDHAAPARIASGIILAGLGVLALVLPALGHP